MKRLKTSELIRAVPLSYTHLQSLLRSGKVPQPERDVSGDMWWSESDVEVVRKAMTIDRRRKPVTT